VAWPLGFAGIAVDVSSGAIVDLSPLSSVGIRDLLTTIFIRLPSLRLLSFRLSMAVSYSLASVGQSIADSIAIVIGFCDTFDACLFSCHDGALYWTLLFQYYHLPG
jgi:hypothetical protein